MDKFVFVGLGELLWDLLPTGDYPGGAVANFAYHAAAQGANGIIVSALGDDDLGHKLRIILNDLNISDIYVSQNPRHPTGTVSVTLSGEGLPEYRIHDDAAWDYVKETPELLSLARTTDAVYFGTLGQRSATTRKTIQTFLQHTEPDCLKLFDINLRSSYYSKQLVHDSMTLANVLKLNEAELTEVAELFEIAGSREDIMASLKATYDLSLIALTMGGDGSILFSGAETSVHPGYHVKVIDTVGAGDAFCAALAVGLKNNETLDEINERANKIASFVCTNGGAMPEYSQDRPGRSL